MSSSAYLFCTTVTLITPNTASWDVWHHQDMQYVVFMLCWLDIFRNVLCLKSLQKQCHHCHYIVSQSSAQMLQISGEKCVCVYVCVKEREREMTSVMFFYVCSTHLWPSTMSVFPSYTCVCVHVCVHWLQHVQLAEDSGDSGKLQVE